MRARVVGQFLYVCNDLRADESVQFGEIPAGGRTELQAIGQQADDKPSSFLSCSSEILSPGSARAARASSISARSISARARRRKASSAKMRFSSTGNPSKASSKDWVLRLTAPVPRTPIYHKRYIADARAYGLAPRRNSARLNGCLRRSRGHLAQTLSKNICKP